jgi:hypothetical protein
MASIYIANILCRLSFNDLYYGFYVLLVTSCYIRVPQYVETRVH